MKLLSPIKRGTKRGYSHNVDLFNIGDMWKCLSQSFGSNPEMYAQFGIVGHNGLDFSYDDGTEVFASHDGVATIGEDSAKGLGVVVATAGYKTIYWHFKSFSVVNGQVVKAGDLIGLGDNTGFSSGPHLHYGLKLLDANGNVLSRDNGYDGAVDPSQYLVWPDHTLMLDKADVEFLQALEGFTDQPGIDFWGDGTHTLKEYKAARVPDKIGELTKLQ